MSKSKKKHRDLCLGCGGKVKPKRPACKRCGRPNPLFAGKAVASPAVIYKAAGGNVTPIGAAKSARPACWNGHTGKRSHKCCTTCGEPFGISKVASEDRALKAAGVIPTGYWADQAAGESNPEQREIMRAKAAAGGRPDPEALARDWGFASLADAAANCLSPEAKSYFMSAYYGTGGQSA